jgi:hypothetical protein
MFKETKPVVTIVGQEPLGPFSPFELGSLSNCRGAREQWVC